MKRVMDISIASVGLILFGPLILCVAALVLFQMGRPVLFVQTRPGLRGQPFSLLKFRTMRIQHSNDATPTDPGDTSRITRLGAILRRTSIDELPSLWNVLVGEMSIVGPRPLLMEYLPLYTSDQARRHEVKPGITGWAQVNGRNALTWEEKFRLDVWYVENRTLALDLRIIWLTAMRVLRPGTDINAGADVTMPVFRGSLDLEDR